MTNQEMVAALKGDIGQKQMLYNYFMDRITSGQNLEEHELPMFEAVRKELSKKTQVVQMSGVAHGVSGVNS